MMLSHAVAFAVALAFMQYENPSTLRAQMPAESTGNEGIRERQLLGCYKLTVGAWIPKLDLGGDAVFTTSPSLIQLTSFPDTAPRTHVSRGFMILPSDGIHPVSYWTPIPGTDSIRLVWSRGFSGVELRVQSVQGKLSGFARTFWDFPRPNQEAQTIGSKVVCSSLFENQTNKLKRPT